VRRAALFALLALAGCGGASNTPEPKPTSTAPVATPRTDVAAIAARARVPVLCWHQIRAQTPSDSAGDRQYIVSPKVLDRQLTALQRAGYHPVSGAQLVAHLARGAKLPAKPVLLTFDDGTQGQYTRALPALKRHHFTATFFVMTVVLGKPGWLSKGEVRALDRAGMEIGAHTWDHHDVRELRGDDYKVQLDQPKRELEKIVGHKVPLFAYPFGVWNARAFPHLGIAGYQAAFQLSDKLDRRQPLWTIRRIIVPEWSGTRLLRELRSDF
jgi:peptidoglycan/xylan/chitin deacetylase (PgdA/CDA1 family)